MCSISRMCNILVFVLISFEKAFSIMKRLPTDLEILNKIYNLYYKTYIDFEIGDSTRNHINFVPIDIAQIARNLRIDVNILFMRLYSLSLKTSRSTGEGSPLNLFIHKMDGERDYINFPYMASLLADLRYENKKYRVAIGFSFFSLIVAILSLISSAYRFVIQPETSRSSNGQTLSVPATSQHQSGTTPIPSSSQNVPIPNQSPKPYNPETQLQRPK